MESKVKKKYYHSSLCSNMPLLLFILLLKKGKGETHTQSVADGLVLVHRPGVLVSDQRRRESERKLSETLTAISHCCGI